MVLLSHGLHIKTNTLISIQKCSRGKQQALVCPGCRVPLIAKKGDTRADHFAHITRDECSWSPESLTHLLGKAFIVQAQAVFLPSYEVAPVSHYFDALEKMSCRWEWYQYIENSFFRPEYGLYEFDAIEVETRVGSIIPDIIGWTLNQKLFIELHVTHGIDPEKLAKIQALNVSTIEINLAGCRDSAEIETRIKTGTHTRWVFHRKAYHALHVVCDHFHLDPVSCMTDDGSN